MAKMWEFKMQVLFRLINTDNYITKEWKMWATSEPQAEAMLAKYIADQSIRGLEPQTVTILEAKLVREE